MLGPLEALIRIHELSVEERAKKPSRRAEVEKERCLLELPPQMIDLHEYLLRKYGKTAVAPIKDGCCSGCYVHIPSSRKNQVQEGIFVCEQCGRLLFEEQKVLDLVDAR